MTTASIMPSLASFKSNLTQKIVVAAEQVNSASTPEPAPHRGKGRR
ncbi:MAG TPA: hypothetical protein VE944_32430 [Nostoc sp.]|nr:hypothetical protein [Nostoc sp.]HYX18978.1 hypothetical protein [Nostoc sp.]